MFRSLSESLSLDFRAAKGDIKYVAHELPQIQALTLQIRDKSKETEDSVARISDRVSNVEKSVESNIGNLRQELRDIMVIHGKA